MVESGSARFPADLRAHLACERRIPRAAEGQELRVDRRPLRQHSVQSFVDRQRRNAESRLLAEILLARRQPPRRQKEVVAEVGAQHARTAIAKQFDQRCRIHLLAVDRDATGGLLAQLFNLLLQRHPGEQVFDTLFCR